MKQKIKKNVYNFAVKQKLTQLCKSTTLQFKEKAQQRAYDKT